MPKTANKVSFLIESQIPDFINEEYELFAKFIQKYYEQNEIQGQPLDIISNLQQYRDIDFYEKNLLKQSSTTTTYVQDVDKSITVVDASSFPKSGGYIKIDDEICFYKSRTDTEFLEVSRGVSGNTKIGDLYEKSTFVTTQANNHILGSTVHNISNLFLYALVKSFEKQYLSNFPEAYLKGDIDKRTLIKNITSFYRAKGTVDSVKFLFKCLIDNDPEPSILYPREHTLKPSDSTWINNYSIKAKVLSGNVNDLIGRKITQTSGDYASAVVDNVQYTGKYDGDELYELILSESSVNGVFSVSTKTTLSKSIDATLGAGDRVNVFSTMGWKNKGKFIVDNEVFTFSDKNVNQFIIESRESNAVYGVGEVVTFGSDVSGNGVELLVYGVVYNLEVENTVPYSNTGDIIDISKSGFVTDDIKIFDTQNNLRWTIGGTAPAITDLNSNVSAIYEDDDSYYIASSGFPSHAIGALPSDAADQKHLKIVRKKPISTTEVYDTKYRDIGIATNGIPFLSQKDDDVIFNGPLKTIDVSKRGNGYKKPPFVLVDGVASQAKTKLAGEVVESVSILIAGGYTSVPTIEILSGRNAQVTPIVTNGEITSISIDNAGEYYSSPPEVRISDLVGRGQFAVYTTEVSNNGQLTNLVKVNGGKGYTSGNVLIDIIPVGSGATATATIKEWRKDRFKKTSVDSENGSFFYNYVTSIGQGYGYLASPTTLRSGDTGAQHSSILGFAYDGNPIYGPYGYSNPLDASHSLIERMTSSYMPVTVRNGGPTESSYPIGTFIQDWVYVHERGSLDKNNGRYCVTPEFPYGTYAYFVTVDDTNVPVYPYIIGESYYSLPVDSNYNSALNQYDLPEKARRLRTSDIENNGDGSSLLIQDVTRGSISSATIESSSDKFSVGSKLVIDENGTGGTGVDAEVDSVKGKSVVSIESQTDKVLYLSLSDTAYLFDGDRVTQGSATGLVVGNVFSATNFPIRSVTGTWSASGTLTSDTKVLTLLLDKNSSYTKGAILALGDGVELPVAKGEVLETTSSQNSVKVKVTQEGFVISSTLFISSSNLLNTPGSKIISINSLSENLDVRTVQDNVALLTTGSNHGVAEGEKITVDVNPNDSTTTTTFNVTSAIYQEVTVEIPVVATVLSDSGIGRFEILNGGADYTPNEYVDIALSGGTGSGAKAKIIVSSAGVVNEITITDKGTGYKKYDILTVGDSDLVKTNANTASLKIEVDHAGFAKEETDLVVASVLGFSVNDKLVIGTEVVTIKSISSNIIEVIRGTKPADHFDGASITLQDAGFTLNSGYQINQETADTTQPYVVSYDTATQKVVFKYGYGVTPTYLTLSSVFKDQSTPTNRVVNIRNVTDPVTCFEIGGERNKIIDIKKYYTYKFDTSHTSMVGKKFDLSPSINYNIVAVEKTKLLTPGVDIKVGFGSRISTNTFTQKVDTPYNKYYYFDNNNIVSAEGAYLNVINDSLQGEKTVLYVTPTQIVYSTDTPVTHDGTGSINYTTKSLFAVGEIDSIKVSNIGNDYKKLPIVTGIVDADGNIDDTVKCYLSSNDIGLPTNIKIISNGGLYHNDDSLKSTFRSNYVFELSNFNKKPFSVGETVIQKSGTVEVARARVTSWTEGSNILVVDKVTGIFRKGQNIIGLAKNQIANLKDISFTEFSPIIQTNYDNVGYYGSDAGKISDANQRIHDSYYYQDFSYTIKSKTSVDTWRQLIKETTHPAGFQLFGEVLIESEVEAKMSDTPAMSRVSVIQAWDPNKNKITVESVRKQITQNIILMDNLNIQNGVGSVALDALNTSEILGKDDIKLNGSFNGSFGNKGNRIGRKEFTLVDQNNNVVVPFNSQALVVTLDGILQEPGKAYTITPNLGTITFAEPPLEGVSFYAKKFQFKNNSLNNKYLKKIRNIFQRNGRWLDASNQIERNKELIQESTLSHIKTVHPNLTWNSLSTKCFRDIGFIVDALAHDIRFGGNEKTKVSLEKYFNNGLLDYIDGELEPTIEAFQYAVGLAKEAINNELTGGFIDTDILTDSGPVKCADVLAALDTLSEVIRVILTTGPDSVAVGYPDYFNGENTIFDLYYEDGKPVDTETNEDLWIALSGVLQVGDSYSIDRTSIPNKIVFSKPPIWGQSKNTKTVYEGLAVERFFGQGIGSYNKFGISINSAGTGPFLIVDDNNDIKSIDNSTFVFVFLDGVLQIENKSYIISGPSIRFMRPISPKNNVHIISLYGRESETTLTLFDYERNQYYNELKLTCDAGSPNDFINWISWYNLSHNDHQVAYQKVGGVKKYIGNVKLYTTTSDTLIVTIAGSNQTLDASNIFFAGKPDFSDEYELTGTTDTLVPVKDGFNENQMQRNSARWLYGTPRADEAYFERNRNGANLIDGDLIKIDGEEEWRTVNKLPRYTTPKNYNLDGDVSNSFHGPVLVTKYSGDTYGTGLSVECTVTDGKVTAITWNKDAGVAGGYYSTPVLQFLPVNKQGGGAKAEVIVQKGTVVDIVITDAGSGYTTAPRVVVTRQFKVIKKNGRKIDSFIELDFENNILVNNLSVTCTITPIRPIEGGPGGPGGPFPGFPGGPPDLPDDGDGTHKDYPWADASWTGKMIQITNVVNLKFIFPAPVAIPQEVVRYWPTVVDSVTVPDMGDRTSLGISILELGAYKVQVGFSTWIDVNGNRLPGDGSPEWPGGPGGPGDGDDGGESSTTYQLGFVDHRFYNPAYNSAPPPLHNTTMRPAFFQWEGAKFMDTGDILSPAGHSVSEYTIEEFDRYGFQLLEFSDYAGSGWSSSQYSMNVAYPTINNYLSQLDTTDLPDANGAGYVATGAVVYANTTKFPATGKILIGRETISYTSKLSDRFVGCSRGADGSPIESHTVGAFLRNAN